MENITGGDTITIPMKPSDKDATLFCQNNSCLTILIPTEDVIHFMLAKDKLVSLAEQMANNSKSSIDLMKFSLKPSIEITTTNMTSMTSMS